MLIIGSGHSKMFKCFKENETLQGILTAIQRYGIFYFGISKNMSPLPWKLHKYQNKMKFGPMKLNTNVTC